MLVLKRLVNGMALLLLAWVLLEAGCTYVPFDFNTVGCGEAILTRFNDSFGYTLEEETSGFEGTLIKRDVNSRAWDLEGTFHFPTRGYTVGEPEIEIVAAWPEQVYIRIPIWSPKIISFVCNSDTEIPVKATIAAAANAEFKVLICSRPEPRCGSSEP